MKGSIRWPAMPVGKQGAGPPVDEDAGSKESYQITRPLMAGYGPATSSRRRSKKTMLEFESRCWQLGMKLLSCFALKLGFAESFYHRSRSGS